DDAVVRQPQLLGALRAAERRQHHRAAGHLLRRERRGARRVLVHQPREQIRVETSPVHADPHRLVMTARHLDHLREPRVALAAADADGAHRDPRRSAAGDVSGGAHACADSTVAALGRHRRGLVSWQGPNRSVRRESGASRNAEGAIPPGNAQAHERQTAERSSFRGASGERWARARVHPPKGSGANRALISQVTGQKGGRRGATRPGRLPLFVVFGRRQAVGRRTALFKLHQELGARMVDFGGWDMPVQYSSQIGEHHAVRRAAGVFDVSHMCIVDLKGAKVRALLEQLLANDVTKLKTPGGALYSCMLNERGGVIDDLIVYYLAESSFRAVVNASTRDKDLLWIRRHAAPLGVEVAERTDLAMLAIQGPEARAKAAQLLAGPGAAAALALGAFTARELDGWFVART